MTTHEQMRRDCEDALAACAWREAELRVATVNDSTYHTIREVAANAPRWVLQLLDEIAELREELAEMEDR